MEPTKETIAVYQDLADNDYHFTYNGYVCFKEKGIYTARKGKLFYTFVDFWHMKVFLFHGYKNAWKTKAYRFDLRKRSK